MYKHRGFCHILRPVLTIALIGSFVGMILAGATPAQAQISGGTDINLSKLSGDQSECAVAKNPANKLQIFVLCNNNAGAGLFAARSVNGGASWSYPDAADKTIADGGNVATQGQAACCNPTLAWDSFGNLFVAYIDSGLSTIVVLLSTDSGQTFSPLKTFASCAGCPDQPTIVAADTTAPGAPVAVWIVWHRNAPTGPMVASGAAVTGLGAVGAFSSPLDIPGTNNCSYGDVAISPAGAVVNVCQNPSTGDAPGNSIFVNTKPDGLGPNPFNAAVTATTTNVGAFHPIPAQSSRTIDSEAGLAYDNSTSPHRGRLYLVYTSETVFGSGDTDIMLRFSDDDGGTWNSPIKINDDATTRSQFFPKVAVNSDSGNIGICWYDARNSATNTAMQVFCTIATPAGATPTFMANGLISDGATTSSSSPNQFGDYSGLAYFKGRAHPAWPDTSNSTLDNPNTTTRFDIYTDTVSGGPAAMEGDPHITAVGGIHYDFQGAGEYVALRDYDGLEIQTRQTPIATTFNPGPDAHDGLATCVSLNTAVAARVGNHRVTYQPNTSGVPDPSGLQLRVDGTLRTLPATGIDLGDGGRVLNGPGGNGIQVDFPDGTALIVTPNWWASQSKWYLNVDAYNTPAILGIMGPMAMGSWIPALPDGTSMGPMPAALHQRYIDLYHKFGNAWRVTDKTSLFDYAPGTSTKTFTLDSWPLEKPPCVIPQTPPVKPAEPGVAERACRLVLDKNMKRDCLFDVTVTGEPGFAKAYLVSQRIRGGATTTILTGNKEVTAPEEAAIFAAVVKRMVHARKGIPAGMVQFMVDGYKAGDPVKLDAKGQATWRTQTLKPGRHKISATYLPAKGSASLSSTSLDILHTVGREKE